MAAPEDQCQEHMLLERPIAASLSAKQLQDELDRRGLRPTGFTTQDARLLQGYLDAEYDAEVDSHRLRKAEIDANRKRDRELAAETERLERESAEEKTAVSNDTTLDGWINLVSTDAGPEHMTIRGVIPAGIRAFVKALAASGNTTLRSLDMCRCGLGDDVGTCLGALLSANSALRRLELDGNCLGPMTMLALRDGALANPTCALASLSLEGCPVTGEEGRDMRGPEALADLIATYGSGADDSGDDRDVTDGGGEEAESHSHGGGNNEPAPRTAEAALTPLAPWPRGLLHLNLFNTRLGQEGGAIIAEAVRGSSALQAIQISAFDGVADDDCAAVFRCVARNRALQAERQARHEADLAEAQAARHEAEKEAAQRAALEAEATWLVGQREARKAARLAAAKAAADAEREERIQRELAETRRREKAKAEAEAEAKAKEAAGKGSGKKK